MFKLIRKYNTIKKYERKILNQTLIWLLFAFVLVRIVPLKWFNSLLGETNKEVEEEINDNSLFLIGVLQTNLKRLKKNLPWKTKCFEEAIAGKKVLEKYDIKTTLYLGLAKKTKTNLKAHAWLKYGKIFVTGEEGHKQFSVVAYYS